jgi:hypothetical protein
MESKVTVNQDYILVEPSVGVIYWEILECLGKLRGTPEYKNKNYIWVFRTGPLMMAYDDLYRLKNIIDENYPQNARPTKTAIVVETGMQFGMANEFKDLLKELPYQINVFYDFEAAKKWVID